MLTLHYKVLAGVGACPWCGAGMKKDAVFTLPMIFKCACGGMWVMTTPPPSIAGVLMIRPGESDGS